MLLVRFIFEGDDDLVAVAAAETDAAVVADFFALAFFGLADFGVSIFRPAPLL